MGKEKVKDRGDGVKMSRDGKGEPRGHGGWGHLG